jgi:hypothetical protein
MFGSFIREVKKRHEFRPSADDEPLGEAEALAQIEKLCRVAGMSAKIIVLAKRNPAMNDDQYEQQRYEKLRLQAVRLADKLSDSFFRSCAIHCLIELCMKAEDVELALVWLKHVRVDKIREKIIATYPQLARTMAEDALGSMGAHSCRETNDWLAQTIRINGIEKAERSRHPGADIAATAKSR